MLYDNKVNYFELDFLVVKPYLKKLELFQSLLHPVYKGVRRRGRRRRRKTSNKLVKRIDFELWDWLYDFY